MICVIILYLVGTYNKLLISNIFTLISIIM